GSDTSVVPSVAHADQLEPFHLRYQMPRSPPSSKTKRPCGDDTALGLPMTVGPSVAHALHDAPFAGVVVLRYQRPLSPPRANTHRVVPSHVALGSPITVAPSEVHADQSVLFVLRRVQSTLLWSRTNWSTPPLSRTITGVDMAAG